jgi:hypothetical protein
MYFLFKRTFPALAQAKKVVDLGCGGDQPIKLEYLGNSPPVPKRSFIQMITLSPILLGLYCNNGTQ